MKMNINLVGLLALVCVGCFLLSNNTKPDIHIGYINMRSLLQKLPEFKSALAHIDSAGKTYQAELKMKTEEYNRKLKDLQSFRGDSAIIRLRAKELEMQGNLIQELQKTSTESMQKMQNDMLSPLLQKIKSVTGNVAQREGFTHVFNEDAAPELLIYANQSAKLDSTVWRALNRTK